MTQAGQWALVYAWLGLRVFPVQARGKAPLVEEGLYAATTDAQTIDRWWCRDPDANIGLPVPPGYLVVDLDGPEARNELAARDLSLPSTAWAVTARGEHHWYRAPGPVRSRTGLLPKLDVKAEGGYVLVPPSVHPTGVVYEWRVGPTEGLGNIAEAPDWLLDLLAEPERSAGPREELDVEAILSGVPEGERDDTLFRYACSLRGRGARRIEAEHLVLAAAADCDPPFSREEALRKVTQAWRYQPNEKQLDVKSRRSGPRRLGTVTGEQLKQRNVQEPNWLVDKLLAPGLGMLVGAPKAGKSWMSQQIARAVASGGTFLDLPCRKGRALVLDLEQGEDRGARRLQLQALDDELSDLVVDYDVRPMPEGLEDLDYTLSVDPFDLVVIDILQTFRSAERRGGNVYAKDYDVLRPIKQVADKHGCCVLLVHHDRKGGGSWLDQASGSRGVTGVLDTYMILDRQEGLPFGRLYVTGRDVEEEREMRIMYNKETNLWELDEPLEVLAGRDALASPWAEAA